MGCRSRLFGSITFLSILVLDLLNVDKFPTRSVRKERSYTDVVLDLLDHQLPFVPIIRCQER
jgi:hypothetical protein